jgi:hypothetical protein
VVQRSYRKYCIDGNDCTILEGTGSPPILCEIQGLVKGSICGEDVGVYSVEQHAQLMQSVLQRRVRQQHTADQHSCGRAHSRRKSSETKPPPK